STRPGLRDTGLRGHRITREKMNRHRITRVAPDLPTGGGLVFRQSSIDRFLKLEVPGIQEIPASAARQLKMDGTPVARHADVERLVAPGGRLLDTVRAE